MLNRLLHCQGRANPCMNPRVRWQWRGCTQGRMRWKEAGGRAGGRTEGWTDVLVLRASRVLETGGGAGAGSGAGVCSSVAVVITTRVMPVPVPAPVPALGVLVAGVAGLSIAGGACMIATGA